MRFPEQWLIDRVWAEAPASKNVLQRSSIENRRLASGRRIPSARVWTHGDGAAALPEICGRIRWGVLLMTTPAWGHAMFVVMSTRMLIQEHQYRPITGNVLALGKQSVGFDAATMASLFSEFGVQVDPDLDVRTFSGDETTRYRGAMSDVDFMKFFGSTINYRTMDVSNYEGADIVHDLNVPIPDELVGQFDFIIDGGTFDHLVDLRTAFRNVVRMLKPSGRIFQWNAASNYTNQSYLSFSPDFFFDFYLINKFVDCRVFVAEGSAAGAQNWKLTQFVPDCVTQYSEYRSAEYVMTVVLAEKGPDSTDHRVPIQQQYRDTDLGLEYRSNLAMMRDSPRPRLRTFGRQRQGYEELGWL